MHIRPPTRAVLYQLQLATKRKDGVHFPIIRLCVISITTERSEMLSAIENVAQENHRNILRLKNDAMRSFILLGKELKTNKEQGYFQSLGYLTFEAYIESPELSIGRRSVYSLIAIYETFVERLGYSLDELSEVDYSKLDRVIPLINVQPVAHREWFEKAKTLPRRELEREVKQAWRTRNGRRPQPVSPTLPTDGLDDWINTVQCGDCLELLQQLPSESIDCCITSPPYWQVRDFGVEGQLGLETTVQEYISKLSRIFDEVKRVLKQEGTCWVNMGDTYASSPAGNRFIAHEGDGVYGRLMEGYTQGGTAPVTSKPTHYGDTPHKCLLQIPARFAIEMCAWGWILRNEVIWHKSNCIPSSVKDRFTLDFEKLFFFVKHDAYWFETQYEKAETVGSVHVGRKGDKGSQIKETVNPTYFDRSYTTGALRHKRCVWRIPTQPFPDAHFAVFPEELVETPIKAGCPEMICRNCGEAKGVSYTDCDCGAGWRTGIVLDPFCGSGTALVVASKLGRQYIGFDLNPDYVQMATERLRATTREKRA